MASAFLGNASGGSRAIRLSSFLTRQSANLAALEPRDALGSSAGGGQSAEVGWIERRVPFGEVDDPDPVIAGQAANGQEKIVDVHPAGPSSGSAGHLRPVDDIDVAVDDDRIGRSHMLERTLQSPFDSVAADFLDADHQI